MAMLPPPMSIEPPATGASLLTQFQMRRGAAWLSSTRNNGGLLFVVLALKVVVIRWWHAAGRFLPLLGASVFVLLALTWFGSAGAFLS